MTSRPPRVAFFADSFLEVNGVALTCRNFDAFARRRELPMLSVHAGEETRTWTEGSVTTFEFSRGRASFGVERDLRFDLLFMRHRAKLRDAVRDFQPDVIHITGPSDCGMLGAILAKELKVPLAASWHTNLHEFGALRLQQQIQFLPDKWRGKLGSVAERQALRYTVMFYQLADVLLAPNPELIEMLHKRTGKPVFLMQRGVDTAMYSPAKRDRSGGPFTIGYVGRLSPEKNVRFLAELERTLLASRSGDFRFLIVGPGSELEWLRENMRHADFPGVLKGEALARAYANMDVFVFPSETDTFGNVVQESLASGVPAVVTAGGGPKFLVRSGETGFVALDGNVMIRCVQQLMTDPALHASMRQAARRHACEASWDRVFERVYSAYDSCVRPGAIQKGISLSAQPSQ